LRRQGIDAANSVPSLSATGSFSYRDGPAVRYSLFRKRFRYPQGKRMTPTERNTFQIAPLRKTGMAVLPEPAFGRSERQRRSGSTFSRTALAYQRQENQGRGGNPGLFWLVAPRVSGP